MMASTGSIQALRRAVLRASVAPTWARAVLEWAVVSVEEHPRQTGVCVCGQTNLRYLYTIANQRNGSVLFPIGSVCVNKFERPDLDEQVDLLAALFRLRDAFRAGERVELDSRHFSRALLAYLHDCGAFPPDEWNHFDGGNDYHFLLDMFNKRDKDSITTSQGKKIWVLVHRKIAPFVITHDRLR